MKAPPSRSLWVLLVSGILGFGFGMLRFPTWQVAVETAQVIAGLVKYPAGNPFYVYHTKLWTVLHQICALLLLSGVSEVTLSRLVSGLVGMVSFQALSLFVYALSADVPLAIGSMIVIFLSNVTDHGAGYPVLLMDTSHTYGALGLSTIVLVVALFGAGCYRTAGFLLGLAFWWALSPPSRWPRVGVPRMISPRRAATGRALRAGRSRPSATSPRSW